MENQWKNRNSAGGESSSGAVAELRKEGIADPSQSHELTQPVLRPADSISLRPALQREVDIG
jgi:hypothetical protein